VVHFAFCTVGLRGHDSGMLLLYCVHFILPHFQLVRIIYNPIAYKLNSKDSSRRKFQYTEIMKLGVKN